MNLQPETSASRTQPTASRRFASSMRALVVLFASTMVAGMLLVLAHDPRATGRFDLTSTREHELSPATLALLSELRGPTRLVVASSHALTDPTSRRRLSDVLSTFARASDKLNVSEIDTSSVEGAERFDQLLRELAQSESGLVDRHRLAVETAIAAADRVEAALKLSADAFDRSGTALIAAISASERISAVDRTAAVDRVKSQTSQESAQLRTIADQVRTSAAQARTLLSENIPGLGIPKLDQAFANVRGGIASALPTLTKVSDEADRRIKAPGTEIPQAIRDIARELADAVNPARDAGARAVAALDALPKLRVLTIAGAVQQSQVALVIGPPTKNTTDSVASQTLPVTAIPIDELLPAPITTPEGNVLIAPDLRWRAEDRIAAALIAMTDRPRPLAVLTHALPGRAAPAWTGLRSLAELLALRGIDLEEWPAGLDINPPKSIEQAQREKRPVVYIILTQAAASTADATRVGSLAKVLDTLFEAGEPMLLCASLSSTKAARAADPMTSFLQPIGIEVESGRPMLSSGILGGRRIALADLDLATPMSEHPIALALQALPLRLQWPLVIRYPGDTVSNASEIKPSEGVRVQPIIRVPIGPSRWLESEWSTFASLNEAQRQSMARPPSFDSPSDDDAGATRAGSTDLSGKFWTLALAVERTVKTRSQPQRIVVVGANTWLLDTMLGARVTVDKRESPALPGNVELAAASVNWLAGRDALIRRGAEASAQATIPALSESQLSTLRWGLTLGPALLVLIIGAARRIARG